MLITGIIMVVLGVLLLVPFLIVIMRQIAAFFVDAWNDRLDDDFYGLFVFGGILLIFAGCVLCLHVWGKRHGLPPPKDPIGFTTEQQEENNNGNRNNN